MAPSRFRGPDIHTVNFQPGVSALKIIQEALKRKGDHLALIDGDTGKTITSAEYLENSSRIAAGLQREGVAPGDLVVLCCEKSIVAYSLILGGMFTGATVVLAPPVNAGSIDQLTSGQVVKALFYDSEFSEPVNQSVSRMSTAPLLSGKADPCDPVIASLLKAPQDFNMYQVEDTKNHVPLVFFSSGTTGQPKGIEISNLHLQLCGLIFRRNPKSLLIASPLYWYSAICILMDSINKNNYLVLTNSNDARHRFQLVEKYKVESFFSSMANMIQYVNEPMFEEFDLSSVKQVMVGGEIVLPSVARPFFSKVLKGRAHLIVAFGSTEAGCISQHEVTNDEDMKKFTVGICGKLFPGLEIKIVDDNGAPVEIGVMGRIWIKSMATKGYWRREDLNRNFLDNEGFYDSGDAGCFDSEGNLYLRGRVVDLINVRGNKIPAAPLEDLLMAHPAVQDAVVVGWPHPSDGQLPAAFVVLRPCSLGTVSEADLRTYVDGQVEDNMRLRGGVHFRESLPRVSNGKVIRKMVV